MSCYAVKLSWLLGKFCATAGISGESYIVHMYGIVLFGDYVTINNV